MDNMWWGYMHANGSLIVKRYFDERDIEEAKESPFVREIFGPIQAPNRQEAYSHFACSIF
jgi:hypothetical protein